LLSRHYFDTFHSGIQSIRKKIADSSLFTHEEELVTDLNFTRGRVIQQIKYLLKDYNMSYAKDQEDPSFKMIPGYSLAEYSLALTTRVLVHLFLYIDSIQDLGTEKHRTLIDKAYRFEDFGCFAMTELGHGSNVSGVETTATFDLKTNSFLFNSPSRTAAKWWVGALADTANMAVVFAQMIVEGQNKGVHAFLIPIRDRLTHDVLPGLVIGDCGKKLASDGIDNGFMLFFNYSAPYDCLLDKYSQVKEGKFKSAIKNKDKRLAVMMAGLIRGRFSVVSGSEINARTCLTIALRYAVVRKQFGTPEQPLINYQVHQHRLIPGVASTVAMRCIGKVFHRMYLEIIPLIKTDPECDEVNELHCLLSAAKVLCSSLSIKITQECRMACGGHGFSSYSAIGRYRGYQDTHATWEGDNAVLIQQTGKFILKVLQKSFKGQKVAQRTLNFLKLDFDEVKTTKFEFSKLEEIDSNLLQHLFEFKVNYLMHSSALKLQENAGKLSEMSEVWNNSQVFLIQDLGFAYGELMMIKEFFSLSARVSKDCSKTGEILQKLAILFSIDTIITNPLVFTEHALSSSQIKLLKDSIIDLCQNLASPSVWILDSLSAPDEVFRSVIGSKDGQVYNRLIEAVEKEKKCYEKPTWLKDLRELRGS
jgi:acyl-CoA oxidase